MVESVDTGDSNLPPSGVPVQVWVLVFSPLLKELVKSTNVSHLQSEKPNSLMEKLRGIQWVIYFLKKETMKILGQIQ